MLSSHFNSAFALAMYEQQIQHQEPQQTHSKNQKKRSTTVTSNSDSSSSCNNSYIMLASAAATSAAARKRSRSASNGSKRNAGSGRKLTKSVSFFLCFSLFTLKGWPHVLFDSKRMRESERVAGIAARRACVDSDASVNSAKLGHTTITE